MMEADDFYDDERAKLLRSHPPNSYSSSVDVPEILEPPNIKRSRWRSIRVMYLTMFLSSVSFSICMSSIWPYLKLLDSSATADLLGWVVSAYSIGQLVASPFFGAWANRRKSREPLVVSVTINILANVLYAYLEDIKSHTIWFLILSRALIGFGAGNVAVVRSYVSGATTIKERTPAMANMSACQAVGFIIGPAIQAAMVPIGFPGPVHMAGIHIDLYTSPAFLSAFVGIINVILVLTVFREHRVTDEAYINANVQVSDSDNFDDYKPDTVAVVSNIVLFFVVLFIFAVFETIMTPLTMDMYGWTRKAATLYVGFILAAAGVLSIGVFVVIKILSKKFNERYILLGGFIFCLLGFIIYLPWGHNYPPLQMIDINQAQTNPNRSILEPALTVTPKYSTTTAGNSTGGSSGEATGCPDSYKWCTYVPIVTLAQLLCGTIMISIGYPTCNVMSYALYSKILGPKPQGTMMGLLTSAGSLARTVGPIYVSQIYNSYGTRVTFISMCILIVLTIAGYLVAFRRLVPLNVNQDIPDTRREGLN